MNERLIATFEQDYPDLSKHARFETGDGWYDLIVLVARHESLVDVADEYLVDGRSGGVADVEVGGREFQPDGDRIVRLGARRVVFASGERRDASRDDGDDRDHGDDGDEDEDGFLGSSHRFNNK